MSFSSLEFYLLAAACVAGYYILPPKARRFWLLFISFIYYAASGPVFFLYLLFAAVTTWAGALRAADGKRIAVAIPLLLDFGVLAALKYSNFAISIINRFPHADLPYLKLLLPLGISFYTFQSAGYLLDVYWKRCEAEKSFIKYLAGGVIERQITLDYVIDQFSKTPIKKMAKPILYILRMGVYQILFMDTVPDSAAVNESVKLTQQLHLMGIDALQHQISSLRG